MEGDEKAPIANQKTLQARGYELPSETKTGFIELGLRQQEILVPVASFIVTTSWFNRSVFQKNI